jgi:hypothetical protein
LGVQSVYLIASLFTFLGDSFFSTFCYFASVIFSIVLAWRTGARIIAFSAAGLATTSTLGLTLAACAVTSTIPAVQSRERLALTEICPVDTNRSEPRGPVFLYFPDSDPVSNAEAHEFLRPIIWSGAHAIVVRRDGNGDAVRSFIAGLVDQMPVSQRAVVVICTGDGIDAADRFLLNWKGNVRGIVVNRLTSVSELERLAKSMRTSSACTPSRLYLTWLATDPLSLTRVAHDAAGRMPRLAITLPIATAFNPIGWRFLRQMQYAND